MHRRIVDTLGWQESALKSLTTVENFKSEHINKYSIIQACHIYILLL